MAYLGRTIVAEPLLDDLRRAAKSSGFSVTTLAEIEGLPLMAFERRGEPGGASVYLSAGIHGDEPGGPLAVLELLGNDLAREITWTICPLLNPVGFRLGTRANGAGVDLNRDYLNLTQAETRAHVEWLRGQDDFDLALFLHEDWEASGFYLYELNPTVDHFSLARPMIEAAEPFCPIEHAPKIDDHDASNGVIIPQQRDLRRRDWPEALYIFTHHNKLSYTLEAPSSFGLHTRVEALREAVRAAADAIAQRE
jgi:murein peptide amidase A